MGEQLKPSRWIQQILNKNQLRGSKMTTWFWGIKTNGHEPTLSASDELRVEHVSSANCLYLKSNIVYHMILIPNLLTMIWTYFILLLLWYFPRKRELVSQPHPPSERYILKRERVGGGLMFEGEPFGNWGIPGVFGCSRLSLLNIYSAENGWKCFLKMVILKETVRFFEKGFFLVQWISLHWGLYIYDESVPHVG